MQEQQLDVLLRAGGRSRQAGVSKIYERYGSTFKHYFRRHGLTAEAAEDLLQETFVKVLRQIDSYQGTGNFEAWLWAVARNTLMSELRSRKPEESLDALDSPVAESIVSARSDSAPSDPRLADCLGRAFTRFTAKFPEYAQVLTRVVLDGWGYEELSVFRKSSNGAAREYLSQCRKRLDEFTRPCLDLAGPF